MKYIFLVLTTFFFYITVKSQSKTYVSNKHTITKADALLTNVTIDKKFFFEFLVFSNSKPNDFGVIWLSNTNRRNDSKNLTYEDEFNIYSIKLKDNGIYNYWTVDIANNGQTVLFQVNLNIAIPTITMFRYAPGNVNTVLKTIVYYLD
jgi:hypothetical protein